MLQSDIREYKNVKIGVHNPKQHFCLFYIMNSLFA